MTTQEAYEAMRAYFSRDGVFLAKTDDGTCWYRSPADGSACAVGCLIPDELYDAEYENDSVSLIIRDRPEIAEHFEGVELDFLQKAQVLHDDATTTTAAEFVDLLDRLAEDFDLEVVR